MIHHAYTFLRAAWASRATYGWQDWTDRTDRGVMIREWQAGRG